MAITVTMKCKDHPSYRAKKRPVGRFGCLTCPTCLFIFETVNPGLVLDAEVLGRLVLEVK